MPPLRLSEPLAACQKQTPAWLREHDYIVETHNMMILGVGLGLGVGPGANPGLDLG